MKLPRFRLRTLMGAVAILAIAMGALIHGARLHSIYRRRAIELRYAELLYRHPKYRGDARQQAKADQLGRLAEKYEHAARYPWLPVSPDPPEPE